MFKKKKKTHRCELVYQAGFNQLSLCLFEKCT